VLQFREYLIFNILNLIHQNTTESSWSEPYLPAASSCRLRTKCSFLNLNKDPKGKQNLSLPHLNTPPTSQIWERLSFSKKNVLTYYDNTGKGGTANPSDATSDEDT